MDDESPGAALYEYSGSTKAENGAACCKVQTEEKASHSAESTQKNKKRLQKGTAA